MPSQVQIGDGSWQSMCLWPRSSGFQQIVPGLYSYEEVTRTSRVYSGIQQCPHTGPVAGHWPVVPSSATSTSRSDDSTVSKGSCQCFSSRQ
eukprot:scaffold421211_cov37-Prasinocladus_malaysianus.AAC.1